MNKILLTAYFTCFFSSVLLAQPQASLLYEVSGNALKQASYLYGTIHLMCEKDFKISETLNAKLSSVEQYVLELDMDDPSMMMTLQQNLMMKDGKRLNDLLEPTSYTKVKDYFAQNMGMPLEQMGMVKPMMLASMMYPSLLGCPIKSYEMEFVKSAKSLSKEVLGLETVEEQMGVFDEIPYKEQANMLVKLVEDKSLAKEEFMGLVAAYKTADIDLLMEKLKESTLEMSPDIEELLLNKRNKMWISKIEQIARDKSTLFAVGAGHLGGDAGVIKLLQDAGYVVEAMEE